MKLSVGDEGPKGIAMDGVREFENMRVIELDRGPIDALRLEDSEEGIVGARSGGCCRMRLRPEAPRPCSCSVMTGDLDIVSYSAAANPASKENRILALSVPLGACARRLPVLRFLGRSKSAGRGDWFLRPRSMFSGYSSLP